MKTSPLQLKWVAYPAASYEMLDGVEPGAAATIKLTAEIRYETDGEHWASLRIESANDSKLNFKFSIDAVAAFSIDLEVAREVYKGPPLVLPVTIAVNMARLLYSSAREMLSMLTARAPLGGILIESVLIEPTDVAIKSEVKPEDILTKIFGISQEQIAAAMGSAKSKSKSLPSKRKVSETK